jgi:translation elongation factor EF-4
MSTIRDRLTANATTLFNTTFDKDVFLDFVEDRLGKYQHLDIGIVSSPRFDYLSAYLKGKERVVRTAMKFPTFAENYECYVWHTQVQIPQQFVDNVVDLLRAQGLRTTLKGACGYDTYDVISVTL